MAGGRRAACGVVAAISAWGGCNAIIGLELPERDLCVEVECVPVDACHEAGVCDPATGQCSSPPAQDGTQCGNEDGNACSQMPICQGGACVSPPAPDGTQCDDGNACTQVDTCQGGACVGTDPVLCPAAGGCQSGCDPATGLCGAPDGTPCDDGSVCTTLDTCQGGVCNSGADPAWAHWVPDAPKRYSVTADVVADGSTGRIWQRIVPAQSFTWADAQEYCTTLSLPGYPSGWRLPTRIELVSIVDYAAALPAIDTAAFPYTPAEYFWTSSVFAGNPNSAWFVHFNVGYSGPNGKGYPFRVRCVR